MPSKSTQLLPSGPTGPGSLSPLGHPSLARRGPGHERRFLTQAAVEVEAIFLGQLLEQMRRAMVQPLKSTSRELQGYQTLVDQQLARTLAAGGGLGLAKRLLEDLTPRQDCPSQEDHHEGKAPDHDNNTP